MARWVFCCNRGVRVAWAAVMEGWVVAGLERRAVCRSGVERRVCRSEVVLSRTLAGSQPGSMGGMYGCCCCGGWYWWVCCA